MSHKELDKYPHWLLLIYSLKTSLLLKFLDTVVSSGLLMCIAKKEQFSIM